MPLRGTFWPGVRSAIGTPTRAPAATPAGVHAPSATPDGKEMFAVCVDRDTGKIIREVKVFDTPNPEPIAAVNSYASPTPVLVGGRLYAHFGSFGTVCLDTATQKVLWKNEELQVMHENGPGSTAVRCSRT